jgi:hypothetical protein
MPTGDAARGSRGPGLSKKGSSRATSWFTAATQLLVIANAAPRTGARDRGKDPAERRTARGAKASPWVASGPGRAKISSALTGASAITSRTGGAWRPSRVGREAGRFSPPSCAADAVVDALLDDLPSRAHASHVPEREEPRLRILVPHCGRNPSVDSCTPHGRHLRPNLLTLWIFRNGSNPDQIWPCPTWSAPERTAVRAARFQTLGAGGQAAG